MCQVDQSGQGPSAAGSKQPGGAYRCLAVWNRPQIAHAAIADKAIMSRMSGKVS